MADNHNGADGLIVLALKVKESLAMMQAQLNQISKKLNLKITGQLDKAKTKKQITNDLDSLTINKTFKLTGKLDKSKTKKQLKSDLKSLDGQQVSINGKLDKNTTKKQLKTDLKSLDGQSKVKVTAKLNTADLKKQLADSKLQLDTSVSGSKGLGQVGDGLDHVNRKSAATVASVTLMHQALNGMERAARNMIDTAADLDQKLTDLRMVTGDSYEEASRLVSGYNALAKELGSTTAQVMDAASEWLRQGKSISETEELITQSMTLSKVGKMAADTATQRLTSTMMGYGLSVEQVAGVVDKLTAVDMAAAVSADGIAEALSHTASSASIAGVSLDQIIASIAVVGETTQRSASVVGESFKTLFSRMGKVTNGAAVDDYGEDISKVEQTLRSLGIELRSSETEFRNFGEVLDDVGAKWDTFTSVKQNEIATAFGGVYQRENFITLMENYDKVSKYIDISANSAGTAAQKFEAYQESVESHYNTMIASAEALAKQTVPAEFMNSLMTAATAIMDFATNTNLLTIALTGLGTALAVKGLTAFGSKLKNVYTSVANLSTAFRLLDKAANVDLNADEFVQLLSATKNLNAAQLKLVVSNKSLTTEQRIAILTASGLTAEEAKQTLITMGLATAEGTATTATFSLSGAFKALGAAIAANPIGFILTALTTALTIFSTVKNKIAEAHQEIIDDGNTAAEEAAKTIELVNAYTELANAVDAGTASKEDMVAAQNDLMAAIGLEKAELDGLIDTYGDLRTAILEATKAKLETDISLAVKGANTAKGDAISDLESWLGTGAFSSGKESEKAIIKWLSDNGYSDSDSSLYLPHSDIWDAFSTPTFEQLAENKKYLNDAMNAVRANFGADNDAFRWLSDAYDKYADSLDPAVEAIDNANSLIAQYYIAAEKAISDPKTAKDFASFKASIINKINADHDWSGSGTYSAEGLVDSILGNDRVYRQFYTGLSDAMDQAADTVAEKSAGIKRTLEALWSSQGFGDTKKAILEMAKGLDGITPDNLDSLIASSAELAALLNEDGMNAQFLANILQTQAMGGDGFALITEDALTLNSALEGMKTRFDEVTDAKSRYDSALAGGEKDDNFKSYAEAMKALNEEFEAGYKNSNQFWAAAEFLFGADQLQEWGWADGLDEIYAAMQRNVSIFGDAESAGTGFLDRLYEISEAGDIKAADGSVIAQIERLSDGTYNFDFDSENLDALAETLGITSEAATACMQALSMYGDFNFYDIEAVMDAVKEIGLSSDALDGTAVNVATLTDQLITLGYNNKDIHDLLDVLREVDGVTLLDANAEVSTLTDSLSDLGLAAKDGVTVTVNADGLADLMSQLNFTKDDTQGLIKKLGEADGITLTNAQGEVVDLNDALEYTDTLKFAGVTSEIDGITSSAELAEKSVNNLQVQIDKLTGKTVTVNVDIKRKSGILGALFGYAKGTDGAPEGDALVGEEGEELIQSGNQAYFAGTDGAEIVHLNEGDKVYTAAETRKIKRGSMLVRGVVPAFAGGTGLGKPSTNTYPSVFPDAPTKTKNTTSTTKHAETEFERLYKYHQHLMKMDQESVSDYIGWLDQAYKAAYDQGEIDLDGYYKYQEEVFDKIKGSLDDLRKAHENALSMDKIKLDNAIDAGDYGEIVQSTANMVDHYKAMQHEVHLQAEYYRSLGYAETSDEISRLGKLWWDYYDQIKNVSADAWEKVVDNANDALDSMTGLYDTLKDAAQTYAESGFITVDNLQQICAWGTQYLAFLEDENGNLEINEANIQKVIAARTEQMAIETALSYVQQLREAMTANDTVALLNLTNATSAAASSTWDLVYAQLQLLGLDSEQYNSALQRINTLRSLTDTTISGIGKVEGTIRKANEEAKKALEEQATALDDILKYVEDMIKQEVENQISALEDQIDRYHDIVDLQK